MGEVSLRLPFANCSVQLLGASFDKETDRKLREDTIHCRLKREDGKAYDMKRHNQEERCYENAT
jgi:hypothetical protein